MTHPPKTSPCHLVTLSPCHFLLAAAVLTSLALPAHAQEGPIVIGRPARPSFLTLDPLSGALTLMGLLEYDTSNSNGAATSSNNAVFQENLTLATGGGIVSKNFLNWYASGTFGLEENYAQSPNRNEINYGLVQAYNLHADLLRSTEFPSSYYARRSENYINRSFQPIVKNIVTDYGATLNYQSPTIPTFLNVYHTDTQQTQLDGSPQFNLSEDHVEFQTSWDPNDHHHLDLNYQYVAVGQENPGSLLQDYQTQNLAVNHDWQIDSAGRYTLSQNLNYSSQTGTFTFDHLRLNELLRMRHSDTFETALNYSYDQQQYAASTSQSHQATASFTHRLFESLTTTGQLGASTASNTFSSTESSPSGSADNTAYLANLAFNYTKKVPLGILGANLSFGANQNDNGPVGATQTVINDFQTFSDPQPIILTRAGVNSNSITVFNASGTREFRPGFDYNVIRVGNTVQIERPIASDINPGDTVRLNYNLDPLPGYSLATTHLGTGLRYDFNEGPLTGLGFYTQYFQQDQSVSSASTLIRPDNVRDILLGSQYNYWKLTLQAEYEDRASSLSPFTAQRFTARYADRLSGRTAFSVIATQNFITYPIDANQTSLTTLDGRLDYIISRQLKAIVSARWRNNEDTRFGNTMGFEETGELRWKLRQTEVFLLLRHTALEASSNQSQSVTAQFGIIRNF